MSQQPHSPSRTIRDTNALIRALVEQETLGYPFWVGGYVTRCFLSDFGHVYFDLTDDDHTISCMIREPVRGTLDLNISNGMDLEVFGKVRVYERQARVQIDVEKIRLIEKPGIMADMKVLEQLQEEGLWPKTRRPLPGKIRTIGLITSKQSEAIHDFEDTYRKEGGAATIRLIDVRVQGQQAGREITDAINRLDRERDTDVIALIRGGGRAADLAVFNDYLIAEAICRSSVPVVTGIGHQRDETIADQVADIREITPTAAGIRLARHSPLHGDATSSKHTNWTAYLIGVIAFLVILSLLIALIARQ
jgi:exodeoxyribonuclease VII large subunit